MWFSRIGDDGNFLETTQDADAFSIASSSAQSDNILHLSQRGGVVALTGGAEFLINSQGPLTPASAQIDEHTSYGVQANVKPCRVGNELLLYNVVVSAYVQCHTDMKLMALSRLNYRKLPRTYLKTMQA